MFTFLFSVTALLKTINGAVDDNDEKVLLNSLMDPALSAKGVNSANGKDYMNNLKEIKEEKQQVRAYYGVFRDVSFPAFAGIPALHPCVFLCQSLSLNGFGLWCGWVKSAN